MTENLTHTTASAVASPAAEAALKALNPEQQAIVRDVMRDHPLLSLDEVLTTLNVAGL
jgi:hypothetical protein